MIVSETIKIEKWINLWHIYYIYIILYVSSPVMRIVKQIFTMRTIDYKVYK